MRGVQARGERRPGTVKSASSQACNTAAAEQVFYHLGELHMALTYALGAGELFNINEKSDYVQAMLGACLASCSAALC